MDDIVLRTNLAYDKIANDYAKAWYNDPVMVPYLERFIKLLANKKLVLDIGCGTCRDTLWLNKNDVFTIGLDISEVMLSIGKKKTTLNSLIRGDIRFLPFKDSYFNGIWCVGVMQHVPKKYINIILKEISRVLTKNAIIFISIPEGSKIHFDSVGRFTNEFTIDELKKLFPSNNLEIIDWSINISQKDTYNSSQIKNWLNVWLKKPNSHIIKSKNIIFKNNCSSLPTCPLCLDFHTTLYEKIGLVNDIHQAILWKTKNFFLLPDIAPLVEGHVLLVTSDHISCYGAISDRKKEEVMYAKSYVENLIYDKYGTWPLLFEHGSTLPLRSGGCIDHAHLHFIPISFDIKENIERLINKGTETTILELYKFYRNNQPYIYLEHKNIGGFIFHTDIIPSQLIRKLIARNLGKTNRWRWQDWFRTPESMNIVKATINKLTSRMYKTVQ